MSEMRDYTTLQVMYILIKIPDLKEKYKISYRKTRMIQKILRLLTR